MQDLAQVHQVITVFKGFLDRRSSFLYNPTVGRADQLGGLNLSFPELFQMTRVTCAGCGQSYAAPPLLLGKTVDCPNCRAKLRIPSAETSRGPGDFLCPPASSWLGNEHWRFAQTRKKLLVNPFAVKLLLGFAVIVVVFIAWMITAAELSNAAIRRAAEREAKQQAEIERVQAAIAAKEQEVERQRKAELDRQESERRRSAELEFVRQEKERIEAEERSRLAKIQDQERAARRIAYEQAQARVNAQRTQAKEQREAAFRQLIATYAEEGFFKDQTLESATSSRRIRGKVLVVKTDWGQRPRLDLDWLESSIPESLRATTPDEVGTIVLVDVSDTVVGEYKGSAQLARVLHYNVSIIDIRAKSRSRSAFFKGGNPPDKIRIRIGGGDMDSGTGSSPDKEVGAWISKLPAEPIADLPSRKPQVNPSAANLNPPPPKISTSPRAPDPLSDPEDDNWPSFVGLLIGTREVRIKNPNDFAVKVGLRSGDKGKDFDVPKNATRSVGVPDGAYEIYFIYSSDPDSVYQGDDFMLAGRGVQISIVEAVDGNYGIRKVK